MDQGKEEFVCLPSKKKEDDLMEQSWKRVKAESRLRKMKMADATATGYIKETKEDADEFEELLEGTVLSPEESSTTNNPKGMKMNVEQAAAGSNQDEELILSPKESSTTNNPKGIMKMNVEQPAAGSNQDEELILSPKESSTNNPKGQKRVREEEEEEEDKDKEKKLKAADSLPDTCTSKFPSTSPIDGFMDFDEDDEMWSSLGDL